MTTLRRIAVSWLTGRGPSATTGPTARRLAAAVVLAALVLAAAGCDRAAAPPPTHRLEGTYIVHGVFPHPRFGGPCKGAEAGYPDIRAGTAVRVRDDATKAELGTTVLHGGTLRDGPLRGNDDDCVFSFSLTVPDRDAYRIEVGQRRGQVRFAKSDLERTGWKADLTVGAYTMFGGI
jgi:hypothetical protein